MDDARSMIEGLQGNESGRGTQEEEGEDVLAKARAMMQSLNLDQNDADQAALEEEKKQNEI